MKKEELDKILNDLKNSNDNSIILENKDLVDSTLEDIYIFLTKNMIINNEIKSVICSIDEKSLELKLELSK